MRASRRQTTISRQSRRVFVGTPNAGTNLANPRNWGTVADVLINLAPISAPFAKLSGLLARLLIAGAEGRVPGLQAQRKISVSTTVIGEGGEYYIARPIFNPAELDQMKSPLEVLVEAFGEKEGGAILAHSAAVLERVTTILATPRPDLSNVR